MLDSVERHLKSRKRTRYINLGYCGVVESFLWFYCYDYFVDYQPPFAPVSASDGVFPSRAAIRRVDDDGKPELSWQPEVSTIC